MGAGGECPISSALEIGDMEIGKYICYQNLSVLNLKS